MNRRIREDIVKNNLTENEEYSNLPSAIAAKLDWFQDQKIGVIFHWGLYSQAGIVESWQLSKEDEWARKPIPWRSDLATLRHDYWQLNREFNPLKFNPNAWAKACKNAGFRYMIFTTKHHDGFNMYDTQYSNYKITNRDCPFSQNPRADVLHEINQAFRKAGIAVGAYYSKADWHCTEYWLPDSDPIGRYASYDPEKEPNHWSKFNQYVQNQLVEICQNYGPIDILWLDGGWVNSQNHEFLAMDKIAKKVWAIKDDTLIVDRTIGGKYENYVTPEQQIPVKPPKKVWESNLTLAKNWGYVPHDTYKSFTEILDNIVKIITLGGNVILGIGPKPDGTLPTQALAIMNKLGAWLKIFGEAVYGTRSAYDKKRGISNLTKKGQYRYLFFRASDCGQKVSLAKLKRQIVSVTNLETRKIVPINAGKIFLPKAQYSYSVLKIKVK